MITCPNCNHQNPDGAVQCEACYTPLPSKMACPSCGASIQSDASFCGQCGADLRAISAPASAPAAEPVSPEPVLSEAVAAPPPPLPVPAPPALAELSALDANEADLPDLVSPDPLVAPEPILPPPPLPATVSAPPETASTAASTAASAASPSPSPAASPPVPQPIAAPARSPSLQPTQTHLQRHTARLLHVQTDTVIELPGNLSPIRIGKPNDRVPPDIDVSGFPESEIVSRVHANVRTEGDIYYIEDVGSSNGTYINNMPLPYGNRHRLRIGDRISLGKGDKVSFIFQLT
ncbi:MAG: FHA domain-containing protein [Cyanobacteria bacterium P01_A01_bin.105]